jgi:hypothetical protein
VVARRSIAGRKVEGQLLELAEQVSAAGSASSAFATVGVEHVEPDAALSPLRGEDPVHREIVRLASVDRDAAEPSHRLGGDAETDLVSLERSRFHGSGIG